jgi:D-alanyl-D-alanine carboxypeptidase
MAVLDRTTRRLINNLKARVRILTALVIILAIALMVMTVLYATKGNKSTETVESSQVTTNNSTPSDAQSATENKAESEQTSAAQSSESSSTKKESSSSASSKVDTSSTATEAVVIGDGLNSWNLKLVNGKNPLPNGFTVKTEKIKATYARDVGMLFDARAVSYLNAMCAAAEKDGINLLVISSHRTNARQTTLYNNQVKKQKANYPNLSDDEVKKKAATISAYPGTSEHELGLAVDFNSVEQSFENSPEYQWLRTHAAEYGFIMRYAKEKQSITGVIYEPWHYRFVGKNHAKKINELGYCFEEYVEYLNKQK